MKKENVNGNRIKKILFIVILLIIVVAAGCICYIERDNITKFVFSKNVVTDNSEYSTNVISNLNTNLIVQEESKVEKEVQIFKGNNRPIAVMIDNHDDARPQSSLNKAYVVYEMMVEGGYTRLMALYKDQDVDNIGPVRSARQYYLDYALEHDAIYVHFGRSPQAEKDLKNMKIDEIEGLNYSNNYFQRTSKKYAPHNVLTSISEILEIAKKKELKVTSTEKSVLNYVTDEVILKNGESAQEIYIPFSSSQKVTFKYDKESKLYIKYANNKKQSDWLTNEDNTYKNLIITFIRNYKLSADDKKDRQGLENIGTKDGYYITNGRAIKITCTKKDRYAKTIYKDLDGNEINVNDGNTYIGICPIDAKVKFTPEENESEELNVQE